MVPAFICPLFEEIFKRNDIISILIDVDKDTWNISERTLKKNYDKDAMCLIVNNMNGLPCEIEKLRKILGEKIIIIEDCAHCLGAKHLGKSVGTFGDAAFFSLCKNLPTISGGFAITKEKLTELPVEKVNLNVLMELIYYLGDMANLYKSFKKVDSLRETDSEEILILGPNKITYKLAGKYILDLDNIINKRKFIAEKLITELEDTKLQFQQNRLGEHIYTYFSFLLPKNLTHKRNEFIDNLLGYGIVARIIWEKPLGAKLGKDSCKNTVEISKRVVTIPLCIDYSEKDINYLTDKIKDSLISC